MAKPVDIAVVGTGAAGLMAAIWAGRASGAHASVVAFDGAAKIGAKILVAGGGRCNVTHDVVDESAYAGSTRPAIRNVLKRFDVARTVEFFRGLGVEVKREETGKLFPVSDDARSVLEALRQAIADAGVVLRHPWRVASIVRDAESFRICRESRTPTHAANHPQEEVVSARRIILATGGMALPKSGSDGQGYSMARALGHTTTGRVFPALVPLTLPRDHWLCSLSGIAASVTVEVRSGKGPPGASGVVLASFTNSLLATHFGISGPAPLDASRYWLDARAAAAESGTPAPMLVVNWLPGWRDVDVEAALIGRGPSPTQPPLASSSSLWRAIVELSSRRSMVPDSPPIAERLARAIAQSASVDPSRAVHTLTRDERRRLVTAIVATELPATGDRGFTFAEATAGGVPLAEVHLKTMESRVCPGLHLCGEILDVDGRIGGFNFQWAWASGFVAGTAAAAAISDARSPDGAASARAEASHETRRADTE